MAEAIPSVPAVKRLPTARGSPLLNTLRRLALYTGVRVIVLFITVVIGVYLTILVANMGGYVDKLREGEITEQVAIQVMSDPALKMLPAEERNRHIAERIQIERKRQGLDTPFLVRSTIYLQNALTLDLGHARNMHSDSGSSRVRLILLERLPSTLVLFATSNLALFFTSVFVALALSRAYGSFFDRLVIAFAPTSSAPGWFYGIFLLLIFAAVLSILPYGGMVDAPPPTDRFLYALSLLKHLILPVLALLMSASAVSIYNWRTFFLIYSSEDYVEMAKAKGLPPRMIERRYILRPTLPTIVTSFALTLIGLWGGAIILETVFNWPGLGRLYYQAIGQMETPVIVAETVIYAYLLAITVFVLDFVYALIDPRVKVGGGAQQ